MNCDEFVNEVVDILSPPVDSNEVTPEQDEQLNELFAELTAERDALKAELRKQEAYTGKVADRCAAVFAQLTELREAAEEAAGFVQPNWPAIERLRAVLAKVPK